MPRRRGGREFKLRQSLAIYNNKPAQKRGNNQLLINTLLAETVKHIARMTNLNIKIVSNIIITHPVFIIDPVGPILLRRVGEFEPEKVDNQSQTDSEASTLILDQPEVITVD